LRLIPKRSAVEKQMAFTGKIIGYDPGGNDNHGVASLIIDDGLPIKLSFATVRNAQAALEWFTIDEMPLAAGIDTLTVLSMSDSGWRPADLWLRENYPQVQNSVVNPNYLQGAMSLNGLAVMISLRSMFESITISETHPKVLYYHFAGVQYNYRTNHGLMDEQLAQWVGLPINTEKEHEWDAAVSCFAVHEGLSDRWTTDLHQLPSDADMTLVRIGGPSYFYWPGLPNQ
jgi:hypothetical protein